MGDLLDRVVRAHGGIERWERVSRFRADVSITGAIWALKGKPGLLKHVTLDGDTRDQRLTITPFPAAGRSATWTPDRQTIETLDGMVVDERRESAASFAGLSRDSPWDDFQVAYFASEANWNYYVAPFILAGPGFQTEETGPWAEYGQVWHRLLVIYPDSIVAHTRQQTYYFDDEGLLRRLDYVVDVLGGGPAVNYPSEYRRFDGIMVPTRRRVYVRRPDGSAVRESVSIAIDVGQVSFG